MNVRRIEKKQDLKEHLKEKSNLREEISKGIQRAKRICAENNISQSFSSYPAPAIGGPIIPVNLFEAILNDDGHKPMPQQRKVDIINQLIGASEERIRKELYQIINPLFWINLVIQKLLRIPFWILKTAGFKAESFEASLAGKILRFTEIIFLIGLLIYFGFSDAELKELIREIVK
ncbi:MAG: hypothetical protein GY829_11110 [Gammaproteobacteria bacterium]|nr:hypothetical protein [Gammaproteobacteria bacterium]